MSDYPYPKLRKDLDDYETSLINCDISAIDSGGPKLILKGEFQLFDEEIQNLIDEGNASYCLFIKCIATNRSECRDVPNKFMYHIQKAYYTDEIVVIPGVVMKEEVRGYTNENLNPDYKDSYIVLPKNAMIAESEKIVVKLYRNSDSPLGSICDFVVGKAFNYTDHGEKIEIGVPREIYEGSNALRNVECSQIFTSMYVFPVIQAVIQEHWIDDPQEYSTRWYISLQEVISTCFPNGIQDRTAFEITSTILENMLYDSTRYLVKHYGDRNEY